MLHQKYFITKFSCLLIRFIMTTDGKHEISLVLKWIFHDVYLIMVLIQNYCSPMAVYIFKKHSKTPFIVYCSEPQNHPHVVF